MQARFRPARFVTEMIVSSFQMSLRNVPIVSLLRWHDLQLGLTACRAQMRHGYLHSGHMQPAPLEEGERLDPLDDLLDLILIKPDAPDGFEFSGLSAAEFWGGMQRYGAEVEALAAMRAELLSQDVYMLRDMLNELQPADKSHYLAKLWGNERLVGAEAPQLRMNEHLNAVRLALFPGGGSHWRCPWRIDVVAEHHAPELAMADDGLWWLQQTPRKAAKHTVRFHHVRLQPRADDVVTAELQITLPSLEASYYSPHFPARNLLAHVRYSGFRSRDGRRVLLIDEIQSDWVADLRRQRRGECRQASPQEGWQATDHMPDVPPCPLAKCWLEESLRAVLEIAKLRGYDCIAWLPPVLVCMVQHELPLGVASELYGQQLPRILRRLLGAEAGCVEYDVYLSHLTVEYRPSAGCWVLYHPSGKYERSGFSTRAAALAAHRKYASPTTLQLPCIDLDRSQPELFEPDSGSLPGATEASRAGRDPGASLFL